LGCASWHHQRSSVVVVCLNHPLYQVHSQALHPSLGRPFKISPNRLDRCVKSSLFTAPPLTRFRPHSDDQLLGIIAITSLQRKDNISTVQNVGGDGGALRQVSPQIPSTFPSRTRFRQPVAQTLHAHVYSFMAHNFGIARRSDTRVMYDLSKSHRGQQTRYRSQTLHWYVSQTGNLWLLEAHARRLHDSPTMRQVQWYRRTRVSKRTDRCMCQALSDNHGTTRLVRHYKTNHSMAVGLCGDLVPPRKLSQK
jgi:hypothetical protein